MIAVSMGFMLLKCKLGLNFRFRGLRNLRKIYVLIHILNLNIIYIRFILKFIMPDKFREKRCCYSCQPAIKLSNRIRLLWCFTILHINAIKIFFVIFKLRKGLPARNAVFIFFTILWRSSDSSVFKSFGNAILICNK